MNILPSGKMSQTSSGSPLDADREQKRILPRADENDERRRAMDAETARVWIPELRNSATRACKSFGFVHDVRGARPLCRLV